MVRTPSYDKSGLKKGTWTPEEDRKLSDYVTKYGYWNWRQLPKYAGLARCGKSCRLRWMNYLRPNIKRGNYSKEEEDTIIRLHEMLGNRWSAIAAKLPGRTDNEIKNHWHTNLKKRCKQNTTTTSNETNPNVSDDFSQCTESSSSQESGVEVDGAEEPKSMHDHQNPATPQINEIISSSTAASYSRQQSQSVFSSVTTDSTQMVADSLDSFWTEPFLPDNSLMLNDDFSGAAAAAEAMMYHPSGSGFLSPGFYDGELFYQYDLFSSL